MIDIRENELLAPYTTLRVGGPARFFCVVRDLLELKESVKFARDKNLKIFILGGGSNLLISDKGFDGLVIKVEFLGRQIVKQDQQHVWIKVGAGENWDGLVAFAVSHLWWGIENLSHIPGSTGAIAVQNIGAYGQEAGQVVEEILVYDVSAGQIKTLKNRECQFAYRSSIFNGSQKGKFVILDLLLKLDKLGAPELSYRDLKLKFEGRLPRLSEIRQVIIDIRDKKFPFPTAAKNGNAGSFFKNPVLSEQDYARLRDKVLGVFGEAGVEGLELKKFADNGQIKLPAAFLIELCGLKHLRNGGAAINYKQPLVIINASGRATADDVYTLACAVRQTVLEKTGIELKFEPELVGF